MYPMDYLRREVLTGLSDEELVARFERHAHDGAQWDNARNVEACREEILRRLRSRTSGAKGNEHA